MNNKISSAVQPQRSRRLFLLLAAALLLLAVWAGARAYIRYSYRTAYSEYVYQYAEEYDLAPSLLFAVIRTESSFRPESVSSVGARGLTQITEETLDWINYRSGENPVSFDQLYDPKTAIRCGAYLLRLLYDEFSDTGTVLCAYHAGWGKVKEWLADPEHSDDGVTIHTVPYGDTSRYREKVLRTQKIYQKLYGME